MQNTAILSHGTVLMSELKLELILILLTHRSIIGVTK